MGNGPTLDAPPVDLRAGAHYSQLGLAWLRSKASRPEYLNAELFLQRAAEAVFHLRAFVVGRRRPLIVRLGLDAQANEIGAGRGDDLGHLGVEIGQVVDRYRAL